ncbi:MAG: EAL domain-containing protein [Coriobacteriales bacterium]|nr:EAL domain-containing protein [Coriobacteriales bacterium]
MVTTQKSFAVPTAIGVALGGVLWVLDAELRSYIFPEGSFVDELLRPSADHFAIRTIALVLMVVAAVMAAALVQLLTHRKHSKTLGDRVRAMYGHTPDPILGIGRDLTIAFANDAAAKKVGLAYEDMVGRRCHEVMNHASEQCEGCRALSVFFTGEAEIREDVEVDASGARQWTNKTWRPYHGEEGDVELVIEVNRDITRLKCYEQEVLERMRAEQDVLAERDRTQRYLDATTSIMVAVDGGGRISMANRRACEVVGRECKPLIGQPWADVFMRDEKGFDHTEVAAELLASPPEDRFETEFLTDEEVLRRVSWGISQLSEGGDEGVLCSGVDVTEQREAENELEFRSFLLDSTSDEIMVHRLDGTPIYANLSFCTNRGLTRDEVLELPPFGWVPTKLRDRIAEVMRSIKTEGGAVFESLVRRSDGRLTPVEVHSLLIGLNGEELVVSSGRDVSERKLAEETIQRMAFYDTLTGLANRALFLDRLRVALANSTRSGHPVAVMFLDLDYFKHINDTLGHSVGDALLQSVAARLAVNVREGDTLARLGGDEFTLVIPECTSTEDAEAIAAKILSAFEEPFDVGGGRQLGVSASLGITMGTGDTLTIEEALGQADAAMYRAKEDGRNRYRSYCEQLGLATSERFSLREKLRLALERDEFVLMFQPQFDAESGAVLGVEALIRWRHPERGLITPSHWLHVAEEAGLLPALGAWTLREVDRTMREWDAAGLGDVRVAINMSPRELLDPKTLSLLSALAQRPDFDASRLELEITETSALSDPEAMCDVLGRVRLLGCTVAIDDFGTGFSSLDHLRRLPIDAIKVDRTFVAEIGTNPDVAIIAGTVVSLAKSLGLRVLAEGVETTAQRDFLLRHGCTSMQGFLFCEPVPASRIVDVVKNNSSMPAAP